MKQIQKTGREFGKTDTYIAKGILVIMLLVHHVFYGDAIETYNIEILSQNTLFVKEIVQWCKICVPGFVFLSAYGMAKNIKSLDEKSSIWKYCGRRLIKLEMSFWFIFVLTWFYIVIFQRNLLPTYYLKADGRFALSYFFVDMLGLASYFQTPTINATWWYLTFAILLIVLMPVLIVAYRKYRYMLVLIAILLPSVVLKENYSFLFEPLLSSAVLGIAFAWEEWFEWLDKKMRKNTCLYIGNVFFLMVILGISFIFFRDIGKFYYFNFAFVISYIAYVPVLRNVLALLGKHSMNIFFTHTFIYLYFYSEFIYSFGQGWKILVIMICLNTLLSMIIEWLKKFLHYNNLVDLVLDKYERCRL